MENTKSYKDYLRYYNRIIRSYTTIDHSAINQQLIMFINKMSDIKSIAGYFAINNELDISTTLSHFLDKGLDIALPRITINKEMNFHKISSLRQVEQHNMLYEPKADLPIIIPDLIIVPSIAISKKGVRIGYGYGYYDKYLKLRGKITISPVPCKFCYNFIPSERHDIMIDYVTTEADTIKT